MHERLISNPEAAFHNAVEALKRRQEQYVVPPWIDNGGNYWLGGVFNPDAYDPNMPHIPKGRVYLLESNPTELLEDPFDLDNLRILEKEKVERLLHDLEERAHNPENGNKLIAGVIGTGGTIAMHEDEKGNLVAGINVEQLLADTGQRVNDKFAASSINFPKLIDSSQMEIDYNAELVIAMSWVWKNASNELKEKFGGFVIAHGTDTMAGSSAYGAMMLGPDCPFSVGWVGAQKTTKDRYTDAYANIKLVFDCLEEFQRTNIKARFVAMGGNVGGAYSAVGAEKISDKLVVSFASPAHPLYIEAGDFGEKGVVDSFYWEYRIDTKGGGWADFPIRKGETEFRPIILRGYSRLLSLHPKEGQDPNSLYNQILNSDATRFVVITTFGSFTVNAKIRKAVIEVAKMSARVIFAANPFPEGKLDHAYEPAVELRKSGVHVTAILPTALEAKILLGEKIFGENTDEIVKFVKYRNYSGEQPPAYWKHFRDRTRSSPDPEYKENEQCVGSGIDPKYWKVLYSGKIPQEFST